MKIGDRIKNRRLELGLTIEQVADQLNISRATAYRYEGGYTEKIPSAILLPLANLLKTTPEYLIGWEEKSNIGIVFWGKFYALCIKNNLKPNSVAKEIGISSGVLTKWKTGTIPNGETLIKLADYFNCSIDFLLGRADYIFDGEYSKHEKRLISEYRNKPEMQSAVDKLLDLNKL